MSSLVALRIKGKLSQASLAPTDLEEWIVGRGRAVGRVDQQHAAKPRPKPRRRVEFSPLMSRTMAEPGQVRNDGTTSPTPFFVLPRFRAHQGHGP